MKRSKKRQAFRIVIRLAVLAAIVFAGVVGYVCIRERSVAKTVPEADQYDAIIVLGA